MSKKPETKIEDSFIKWLKESTWIAWAPKLILFAGMGFPDRTVLCNGKVIFLEFKTPKGELSPQQIKIHKLLKRVGFHVYVPTSLTQAQKFLLKEVEAS